MIKLIEIAMSIYVERFVSSQKGKKILESDEMKLIVNDGGFSL